MNDRLVVQEVIKEIAETKSVNVASQTRPFKGAASRAAEQLL